MAYLRDTAFVLSSEPYRESDAWLTLYGETHGKLVGVARGARNAHSKQRGHLEPFSKIEVMLAKGQSVDKIAVAQSCASSHQLRASLAGMAVFGSALTLVARATEPAVPNPRLFALLDELRAVLSSEETQRISMERASLIFSSFALHLLQAEGYAMDFARCRSCEQALTKDLVWFSLELGGVICRSCYARQPQSPQQGAWISVAVLQTIRFLLREPLAVVFVLSAPRSVLQETSAAIDRMLNVLPRAAQNPAHEFLLTLS